MTWEKFTVVSSRECDGRCWAGIYPGEKAWKLIDPHLPPRFVCSVACMREVTRNITDNLYAWTPVVARDFLA